MSSNINQIEYDAVNKLSMQPVRGILKIGKSSEDVPVATSDCSTTGMTRSESKSHKIPHFDEMNIIATYHPLDKDYGHMKIDEPKTPYAAGDNIDEEMETELTDHEATSPGVDPDALAQKLFQSSDSFQLTRRSIDESVVSSPEAEEHRKQFENHRKKHYNEFEMVRLHKKEIEDELRALEQEEERGKSSASTSNESIKPILIHDTSSHHHHQQQQHVRVEIDPQHEVDDQHLTAEERERKKQFELKRKKHYNEYHVVVAQSANKEDEK